MPSKIQKVLPKNAVKLVLHKMESKVIEKFIIRKGIEEIVL